MLLCRGLGIDGCCTGEARIELVGNEDTEDAGEEGEVVQEDEEAEDVRDELELRVRGARIGEAC